MTFFKQLSNKHSSSAEILETHKLNSAIHILRSRTEASRTKDPITKRILKPDIPSPNIHWSQTFCRQTFQIWALNRQRCRIPKTGTQSSNTQTSRISILQTDIINTDIQNRHPWNAPITKTSGTPSSTLDEKMDLLGFAHCANLLQI